MTLRFSAVGYVQAYVAAAETKLIEAEAVRQSSKVLRQHVLALTSPANRELASRFVGWGATPPEETMNAFRVIAEEGANMEDFRKIIRGIDRVGTILVPSVEHIIGLQGQRTIKCAALLDGSAISVLPTRFEGYDMSHCFKEQMADHDFEMIISCIADVRAYLRSVVNGARSRR